MTPVGVVWRHARYEFSQGNSNEFWEITRAGSSVTTTYGKIAE